MHFERPHDVNEQLNPRKTQNYCRPTQLPELRRILYQNCSPNVGVPVVPLAVMRMEK